MTTPPPHLIMLVNERAVTFDLECHGKGIPHTLAPGSHPLAPSARRHEQLGSLAQGLWPISTETNERQ